MKRNKKFGEDYTMNKNSKRDAIKRFIILAVVLCIAIVIAVLLTSCIAPAVQATDEVSEVPSQEIQESVSPEFYKESFKHAGEFCIRYMLVENLALTNEVDDEEYEEFLEIYRNVFKSVLESEKDFKQSQEKFNTFTTRIFGEEMYIEPKTNVDQTAFLDAMAFYTSYDLVSLQFLYGTISLEKYEEVDAKADEVLKDITHEKVNEFLDYVMEVLMQETLEDNPSGPNKIGEPV